MAILKCKMCGGELNLEDGMTVAECEYCGTRQTVPTADNEKKMTLFARANRLRAACEFDKAAGIYESIVAEFPEEAEAYWGLVLCKYGIEYVDDPATGKKIPTCHRSSFDSIMDDSDFEQVMENADAIARRVYREEAKTIENIRKGILDVSSKEEPYDIFICYKETDENGNRTIDSVIAQNIYKELTNEGYRVFFARISLEDKLGSAYEPYIFAALNSAKVMLAVGTDYDYFNAVWVKNEWSRFLALIAKGEKKTLIPCYKDIDAYDIPKEFRHLQAQDMGKVGAMQDLIRGINKITNFERFQPRVTEGFTQRINANSLLKRAFIFLEDEKWSEANNYCERTLDADAENAWAYLGIAMAKTQCRDKDTFANKYIHDKLSVDVSGEIKRAKQFGKADIKGWFASLDQKIADNQADLEAKKTAAKESKYNEACDLQASEKKESLIAAIQTFKSLEEFKDSSERAEECNRTIAKIEEEEKESKYREACNLQASGKKENLISAARTFRFLDKYKDSSERAVECCRTITNIDNEFKYNGARDLQASGKKGNLITAAQTFKSLEKYKDSSERAEECSRAIAKIEEAEKESKYNEACDLQASGGKENLMSAARTFGFLDKYKDSSKRAIECRRTITNIDNELKYNEACILQASHEEKSLLKAAQSFESLKDYKDSITRAKESRHQLELKKSERESRSAQEKMRQQKVATLNNEKKNLLNERSGLKGFFSGVRRKKIEARLAEIETELKNLY